MQHDRTENDGASRIPLWGKNDIVRAWVLVDADDFEWLNQWRWFMSSTGYAIRFEGGRLPNRVTVRMHRRILGLEPSDRRHTDHINRDRLDNRRANLRVVSEAANHQNITPRTGGTSEYRGVSYCARTRRWVAGASTQGKRFCKHFDTELEAAEAAAAWRREHMPYATN
jgi:hypothetical protein